MSCTDLLGCLMLLAGEGQLLRGLLTVGISVLLGQLCQLLLHHTLTPGLVQMQNLHHAWGSLPISKGQRFDAGYTNVPY